jgi:formamidopyrimidine-DNA glycosylase
MPELPEVQTVVTTIRPRIAGRMIRALEVIRPDVVRPAGVDLPSLLIGSTVAGVDRRGKKIVIRTTGGDRVVIHLGMTGRLAVELPGAVRRPHTHVVFGFDGVELRFSDPRRFGGVWWLGTDGRPDERMGPEPLSLRPAQLRRRRAKTSRAIKNALMDQSVVAGLGNIYVDESLHRAGIHPLSPANTLADPQVARLNRAIKLVLRTAIRHRGSTLRDYADGEGRPGEFQSRHRVYGRAGRPCRTCRTPIARIVLGARSTHFCPHCQKNVEAAAL